MDLIEQAAGVWARKLVVLAIAVAAALGVFAWRSAAPEQYLASTTVQVRLPESGTTDPAVQVPYYALSVSGLAESRDVVVDALAEAGRADEDPDEAGEDISASIDSETGFVTITAAGPSGAGAAALADALADTLAAAVATDQADDLDVQRSALSDSIAALARERRDSRDDKYAIAALEREREALLGALRNLADQVPWRLAVVEPAQAPASPESPRPLRDALLAFIIALVLAAEGVVITRAVRGSLSARDPGADVAELVGVPAVLVGDADGPTALAPILSTVGSSRAVTVVQRGRVPGAHGAVLLARLLTARGDDVLLVDAAPDIPTVHTAVDVALSPGLTELGTGTDALDGLPDAGGVRVLAAGPPAPGSQAARVTRVVEAAPQDRVVVAAGSRVVDDLLPISAALDGPTVLEIDTHATRRQLRKEVAAIRGLGLDVVAVVVHRQARRASTARASVNRTPADPAAADPAAAPV